MQFIYVNERLKNTFIVLQMMFRVYKMGLIQRRNEQD